MTIRIQRDRTREVNRRRNRAHRAEQNAAYVDRMLARTPDQLARDRAEFYPAGRATCRSCGHTRPLDEFKPAPHKRRGVQNYCRDCWEPDHA